MLFLVEGKQMTKISMIIISKTQNIKITISNSIKLKLDYSSNIREKGYKDCKVTENYWFKMQYAN